MMSKLRQIFSEKLKLSGIRGCMAAGAMTAGIAALAVIGGVNSEDISTVSFETDVIPEETVAVEAVQKKTYAHDMEYFSSEDMGKMTSAKKEEASEAGEINEAAAPEDEAVSEAEETAAAETEAPAEETSAETEETVPEEPSADENSVVNEDEESSSVEEEAFETEETADSEAASEDIAEASEESPENEENEQPEAEQEAYESVSARISAAGGDEDDGGLSSALDIETESANEEAPEADDYIIVYSEAEKTTFRAAVAEEPEAAAAVSENTDDIPEDITLDDKAEYESEAAESTPAPQEGAISQFDLPEWLEFDENGVPTEYVQVLTGNACAYTADPDALMSTGKEVFQGYVAVDPDIIPYGTELYIVAEDGEVYGYAIAADTGYSVRKGHIIVDLFMNEYDDCIQWGNKPVYVYVLK